MLLERIVRENREVVAARKRRRPLGEFASSLRPSERGLLSALASPRAGLILECKKASPSKGLLRPDFDVAALARAYAPWATAISVLTDAPFFQGSLENLRKVSRAVSLPVLCKDFVVDPYQLYEARDFGADAILLLCSVLDDSQLVQCMEVARRLRLDPLVEVHDEAELRRAAALGAPIIGINNRNLSNLEVDLSVTERLAPLAPRDCLLVSESGIRDHGDVVRLRGLVDAFLVGSSMMTEPDVERAARRLIHGRVKVCGLMGREDAGKVA